MIINNNLVIVMLISITVLMLLYIFNQKKCNSDIKLVQYALKKYFKDFASD